MNGAVIARVRHPLSLRIWPGRRAPSGVTGKGGRWEVHYDPYDLSLIWVRNHHHGGWITVPWTHMAMVGQPFADFTWRHARTIAAERGIDDANETAVAAVLAALLREAGQGPPATRRAIARTRAVAALPARPARGGPATRADEASPGRPGSRAGPRPGRRPRR
jgi:hypothetical protein